MTADHHSFCLGFEMENQLQLIIKTPLDSFPAMVEFNYTELQQALQNSLQAYQGIAYTSDMMRAAKTDRATLNKLKKAIDAERRSVKAICMKPYEDFDRKTRELLTMIDEPVNAIDSQIKAYEHKQRNLRKQHLQEFYETAAGNLAENIPFSSIYQDQWTNATANVRAVEESLIASIEKFSADLKTIAEKCGEFAVPCQAVYYRTRNLAEAMNEETRLSRIKEQQEQAKEVKRAPELPKPEPAVITPEPEKKASEPQQQDEKTYTLAFRVTATAKQLNALKAFLINNNILYERA